MSKRSSSKSKKKRIFCNRCKTETNHTCKGEHIGPLDNNGFFDSYRLLICDGCEQGTLEECVSEVELDEDGNIISPADDVFTQYHPSRIKLHIQRKKFVKLPEKLDDLYREVLLALNNDEPVLCAVGIRALIEGICADKEIKGRNLETKIDSMGNILPPNIIAGIHGIRFIGNVAAHELTAPASEELRLAIEISEDLLNYLYELDYKARSMAVAQGAKKLFKPTRQSEM